MENRGAGTRVQSMREVQQLGEEGAGAVVPAADPVALSKVVGDLLDDTERRQRVAAAARTWARGRCWSDVASPLLEFAAAPRRDPYRARFSDLAPGGVAAEGPLLRLLQRKLGRRRSRR